MFFSVPQDVFFCFLRREKPAPGLSLLVVIVSGCFNFEDFNFLKSKKTNKKQ